MLQIKRARSQSFEPARSGDQLLRSMRLARQRAQRTSYLRQIADRAQGISAASRAGRNAAVRIKLDVGGQCTHGAVGTRLLAGFQCPFVNSGGDLAHVVNASVLLRGGTSFHEVGNGDGGQQTNDGHNNHNFHQGETRFTGLFHLFHTLTFFFRVAVEHNHERDYKDGMFVHFIARGNRYLYQNKS